jgi:hypothetical protein
VKKLFLMGPILSIIKILALLGLILSIIGCEVEVDSECLVIHKKAFELKDENKMWCYSIGEPEEIKARYCTMYRAEVVENETN